MVQELENLRGFKGVSGTISYKPFQADDPSCRQGQKETFLVKCLPDGRSEALTGWFSVD